MIINHNLPGANAISRMNTNAATASKSMQKLSSGLRINGASDDAAGLAISEKMRGQIRGLDQASANSQDGISMIQTAEGALSETHSILQRMRELAVQSANDTNVAVDRGEIQKEMDQLTKEVSRISNNTEFNTQKLINGGITDSGVGSATFHVGANAGQNINLSINAMDAKSLGITRDVSTSTVDGNSNAAKVASVSSDSVDVTKSLADGKYQVKVEGIAAGATTATDARGNVIDDLVSGTATADTNITLTYTDHGTSATNVGATALGAATDFDTATSITVNGKSVALTAVKALGADYVANTTAGSQAAANALKADLSAVFGNDKFNVTADASFKLTITNLTTGSDSKVDLTGSNTTSAGLLGFNNTVLTGTNGAATGGVKDWVATGSIGGVVSPTNNTVNGVTIDISQAPANAVAGDKLTIKGFKDATVSAQLMTGTGAGAGVPYFAQSNGAAAVVAPGTAGATVGTATANTNITLTYQAAATVATATAAATAMGASAADTLGFDIGAGGSNANGITVKMDNTGSGTANVSAEWDKDSNTITIKLGSTQANNTAANIQSAMRTLGTAGVITKDDGSTVNLAASIVTGAGTWTGAGSLSADAHGQTTFKGGVTAKTASWVASGDLTGSYTVATTVGATVNGLSIDFAKITGAPVNGETVKITANVTSKIGDAVTIDKKNGGSYVLGDTNSLGQAKVTFSAGQATVGQSTVDIRTDVASAAVKQTDGTMSNATAVGGLDVSTQAKASASITTLQTAIEKVSSERSKLGAYQNRLEHTIANLGTSSENLTSAESRIRDVDMAKEMSTFSKNNILSQAAQAMLAQANQQPQQVLQLLR